jgi:protein-tyrosine-phosphatase
MHRLPGRSPHLHEFAARQPGDSATIDRTRVRRELTMTDMLDPVTRQHVEKAASALQDEFAGVFSRETIARFIAESVDMLGDSKIAVFVPVLAHRFARERMRALGQAEGVLTKNGPEVLFVCVQNVGRSQMAAGLLTLRSGGLAHPRSAGSNPAEEVNPYAALAMAELGIDLKEAFPKPLTDEVVRAADVVVTMAAAMRARSIPASGTRTGRSATRRRQSRSPKFA